MISQKTWLNINNKQLGLRSEDNETTIKNFGHSYAMDMRVAVSDVLKGVPADWEKKLLETIKRMKGFPNADKRFLMIVSRSTGTSAEYTDCFPKSSIKADKIYAVTSLKQDVKELTVWVEKMLESI